MEEGKLQVVFLVNTRMPSDGSSLEQHHRAQCLACMHILMSRFSNRPSQHQQLQWNYKFFSSESPAKALRVSTAGFHEVRSELLELFFGELLAQLEEPSGQQKMPSQQNGWSRCVYNVLAAAVQDFIWDAPEIKSPVRPKVRQQGTKLRRAATAKNKSPYRNVIFVFSEGPSSENATPATLINQVLPKALLSQLHLKGISIHWVHCGAGMDAPWAKEMSLGLREVGGTVVPLWALLKPASPLNLIPRLLSGLVYRPAVDRSRLHWLCSKDGEVICTLQLTEMYGPQSNSRATLPPMMTQDVGQLNHPSSKSHHEAKKACFLLPSKPDERTRKLVVAMGLVRWSSFSLHLLDLSATCCCSAPSGTTGQYSDLCYRLARSNSLLLVKVIDEEGEGTRWGFLQATSLTSSLNFIKRCHYEKVESLLVKPPNQIPSASGETWEHFLGLDFPAASSPIPSRFTYSCLHPWFPFSQASGVRSLKQLHDVQVARKEEGEGVLEKREDLVYKWRELYSMQDLASADCASTGDQGEEEGREHLLEPPTPEWSVEELWDQLKTSYKEKLLVQEVDELHQWVSKSLSRLLQQLQREVDTTSCDPPSSLQLQRVVEARSCDPPPSIQLQQGVEAGSCDPPPSLQLQRGVEAGPCNPPPSLQLQRGVEAGPCDPPPSLQLQRGVEAGSCDPPPSLQLQREVEAGSCDPPPSLQLQRGVEAGPCNPPPSLQLQRGVEAGPCNPPPSLQLWSKLHSEVLLSLPQLSAKYSCSTEQPETRVNEHLLQVLLRFECVHLCGETIEDHAAIAVELIGLLQKVACLGNPRVMASLMETVLLEYRASCKELVEEVCEALMFPLDIEEPSSSPVAEEGDVGSDDMLGVDPVSPERPSAPAPHKPAAKRLARHMSFQEVSNRRLITVPKKKAKQLAKVADKSGKPLDEAPIGRSATERATSLKRRKSVCRSLFSRSHTVADFGSKRKGVGHKGALDPSRKGAGYRGALELGSKGHRGSVRHKKDILVAETPLKLQVSSKVNIGKSPLRTVKESPRRSFYSVSRRRVITPKFKTPPISRRIALPPLINDPSPSTLHSLLYDSFVSPSQGSVATAAATTSPLVSTVTTAPLVATSAPSLDWVDRPQQIPPPPADILSSAELFKMTCNQKEEPQPKRNTPQLRRSDGHCGYRSARMLTYGEREDPFAAGDNSPVKSHAVLGSPANKPQRVLVKVRTPAKSLKTLLRPTRMLITCVTPTKTSNSPVGVYGSSPVSEEATDVLTRAPNKRGTPDRLSRTPDVLSRTPNGTPHVLPRTPAAEATPVNRSPDSVTPVLFSGTPSANLSLNLTPVKVGRSPVPRTPTKSFRTTPKTSRKLRHLLGMKRPSNSPNRTPTKTSKTQMALSRATAESSEVPIESYTSPLKTPTKSARTRQTPFMSPAVKAKKKSPVRLRSLMLGVKRLGSSRHKGNSINKHSTDSHGSSSCEVSGITRSLPTTPTNSRDRVVLLSLPRCGSRGGGGSSEEDGFFLPHSDINCNSPSSVDPALQDSASMVAFSLSTPTKDDPRDFHRAFSQSADCDNTANI